MELAPPLSRKPLSYLIMKFIKGDPPSFYYDVIRQEDNIRILFATIKTGRVIPAGEKVEMVGTTTSEKMLIFL